MSTAPACSTASAEALEPIAGTASRADDYLLLEVREQWAPDVVATNDLPEPARVRIAGWQREHPRGRVLFIRRPDRRTGPTAVFVARCEEHGGTVGRVELDGWDELADADLTVGSAGPALPLPLWLVCGHGRRDACCALLGTPVFDAFRQLLGPGEEVWQCSHLGGHRFAANVLALPHAVLLGRVRPVDVGRIVAALKAGTLPLPFLRGRTIYEPEVQAADLHVREQMGLAHIGALRYLGPALDGDRHDFATPSFTVRVAVEKGVGPDVPPSCGKPAEPTVSLVPRIVDVWQP